MNADQQAEKILNTLELQRFADWYNSGRFNAYISGDLPTVSKEDIINDIKRMFRLETP